MGEGIGADDRLVARRRTVGDLRQGATCGQYLGGVDAGRHAEQVGTGPERHHHIFQRAIAGALANAVDGALHLPRAAPRSEAHTSELQSLMHNSYAVFCLKKKKKKKRTYKHKKRSIDKNIKYRTYKITN